MPSADRIAVSVRESGDGHVAEVTVNDREATTHRVRVSRAERERYCEAADHRRDRAEDYGSENVADLVKRSFEFLLARESNTSILREFDLSTIERYFPEYPQVIRTGTSDRS